MSDPQVVFDVPPVPDQEYVRVAVTEGVGDEQPFGYWEHIAARIQGALTIHVQEDGPKPISETWAEARAYAGSRGLKWIYVDDPDGQFPDAELGVMKKPT